MKLEEVLPHLRNGGKVRIPGRDGWKFTDHELSNQFSCLALQLIDDFEIIKESYKKSFFTHGNFDVFKLLDSIPHHEFLYKGKNYKVTIEEVEE